MNREKFEWLVARAVDSLPEEFRTKLENIDVVVEELCTMDVARMPMKSPTNGLDVSEIRLSAKPSPNSLKEALIRFMLKRKT